MIKVVFLILNYKTYSETISVCKELLGSIKDDYRIVIVDNASPNDSFAVLSNTFNDNPYVDVISSGENGGYAKGNNFGLRYIEKLNPDYVAIMNNDVHFNMNIIERLISDFKKIENIGAIAPVQCNPDGKPTRFHDLRCHTFWDDVFDNFRIKTNSSHTYKSNTNVESIQRVGIVPGAFIFSKYSVLKSINYFDESTFLYCEERFLSKRLESMGKYCYIDFGCLYIHEHSITIDSVSSKKHQMEMLRQSRLLFIKKYGRYPKIEGMIYRISNIFPYLLQKMVMIKKTIHG